MPASPAVDTRANIDYATHDGVTLLGDLYLPTAGGPFPALVAVHGGGWQAGARSAFQYWGPYLAARGYVLFAISYRLAKKGHKAFPQAVTDLLAAVQFVRGSAAQIKSIPSASGCSALPRARILPRSRRSVRTARRSKMRYPNESSRRRQQQGEGVRWRLRRLRCRRDVAALPAAKPAREQHREFHGLRADGRSAPLFRGVAR